MSWQTLLVSNPCKLSIKHSNILLRRLEEEDAIIAINELSSIVIENPQVSLTAVFIAECAKHNIAIIFTDKKHMPVGVFYPFHQHSRMAKHSFLQNAWSQPFKNRVWQKIIQAKIANQKQILFRITKQENHKLASIISQVQSGDKTNRESYAAGLYWRALFDNFQRNNENDIRNSALDYGYSIIRSAIARSISATGFMPVFGVHHKSELNAFNLADDLIEPFRPFVDFEVYQLNKEHANAKLTAQMRIKLVNILNTRIGFNKQQTTLLNAIQQTIFSLLKASELKETKHLSFPYYAN